MSLKISPGCKGHCTVVDVPDHEEFLQHHDDDDDEDEDDHDDSTMLLPGQPQDHENQPRGEVFMRPRFDASGSTCSSSSATVAGFFLPRLNVRGTDEKVSRVSDMLLRTCSTAPSTELTEGVSTSEVFVSKNLTSTTSSSKKTEANNTIRFEFNITASSIVPSTSQSEVSTETLLVHNIDTITVNTIDNINNNTLSAQPPAGGGLAEETFAEESVNRAAASFSQYKFSPIENATRYGEISGSSTTEPKFVRVEQGSTTSQTSRRTRSSSQSPDDSLKTHLIDNIHHYPHSLPFENDPRSTSSSSRQTMGYEIISTENKPPSWNVHVDSTSEKMESSTQRTESERTYNSHRGDDDDNTTIRSLDSAVDSNATTPLFGYAIPDSHLQLNTSHTTTILGTPSTISTAPSTDEASTTGMDTMAIATVMAGGYQHQQQLLHHRRVPSWEGLPPRHVAISTDLPEPLHYSQVVQLSPSGAWGQRRPHQLQQHHLQQQQMQQQLVASFRGEQSGYPPMAPSTANRWQQQPPQQRHPEAQVPFLPTSRGAGGDTRFHQTTPTYNNSNNASFTIHDRRPQAFGPPLAPSASTTATPPRRTQPRIQTSSTPPSSSTPQGVNSPHRFHSSGTGLPSPTSASARSSSEVLKTLLRKKACLYEPDTSRAVTLITWLVGRHLALEYGYFSRQQLQAGVHCCVAHKIESGVITRTKVNRCMQIILNSCFHYIIPRPDGTEEKGDTFRRIFAQEVSDDEFLLHRLPSPWHDMTVNLEDVLKAAQGDGCSPASTPQSSPQLTSVNAKDKPSPEGKDSLDDKDDGKRAVLLCFNENVRSAEDVFRCHNEFIHDTAHASNLQLSSVEWRQFFGKEAAGAPFLWGNVGIPLTHKEGKDRTQMDALGVMSNKEAASFRTSWCCKRYDHNHELCGFAHSEVNGGWLRRNPSLHEYKDEMCPFISKLSHERSGSKVLILNECPYGVDCGRAHSVEEIIYHPLRYKACICKNASRPGGCSLGDICPNFHPMESYKFPKKPDGRSPRHARQAQQQMHTSKSAAGMLPVGAPILYVSPAPLSSFEKQLLTPGLRNLYRRHCSVSRALLRNENKPVTYNCFGDDVVVASSQDKQQQQRAREHWNR